MHANLERRFVALANAELAYLTAIDAFASRFQLLFAALAQDMGVTPEALAKRLGWDPIPEGGNYIMRGVVEPSPGDCMRLLAIYQEHVEGRSKT